MLTILVGQNTDARLKHLQGILDKERALGADILIYNDVNFNQDEVLISAQSVSLFEKKNIFVISNVCENPETRDLLEKIVNEIIESSEKFILSERNLLAPFLKKVSKKSEIIRFDEKEEEKKQDSNIFALTDAYSERKRSHTWAIYRSLISSGVDVYDIHSKILWVIKNLIIVKRVSSVSNSGLHPYVFSKTKKSAEKFSLEKLQDDLIKLVQMLNENSFSPDILEAKLEVFILQSLE